MKELTKTEELVLLSILRLDEEAYGVSIKGQIEQTTGKSYPYGTLYFILDQLTQKGLVERKKGAPTPERGGRSKTYYRLTSEGRDSLNRAFELQKKTWNGYASIKYKEADK
jgi:DNA-binding PadR family transcriptional regulator